MGQCSPCTCIARMRASRGRSRTVSYAAPRAERTNISSRDTTKHARTSLQVIESNFQSLRLFLFVASLSSFSCGQQLELLLSFGSGYIYTGRITMECSKRGFIQVAHFTYRIYRSTLVLYIMTKMYEAVYLNPS